MGSITSRPGGRLARQQLHLLVGELRVLLRGVTLLPELLGDLLLPGLLPVATAHEALGLELLLGLGGEVGVLRLHGHCVATFAHRNRMLSASGAGPARVRERDLASIDTGRVSNVIGP